jgi:7-carboxy-7-deazaguanine synthase
MKMKVIERCRTLMGEGRYLGTPCYLIRFATCDLDCKWCDTKEKMVHSPVEDMSPKKLVEGIPPSAGTSTVLLTGGEPMIQEGILELCSLLLALRYHVHIQSNGKHIPWQHPRVAYSLDLKPPSSGNPTKDFMPLQSLYPRKDEIKMVVKDLEDIIWWETVRNKLPLGKVPFYFSPLYDLLYHKRVEWLIDTLRKRSIDLPITFQVHKLLNFP